MTHTGETMQISDATYAERMAVEPYHRSRMAIAGFLLLVSWLVAASGQAFSAPSQSCNQSIDRCVADRVAAGSKPANAQTRCAEILSKCKKK